MSNLSDLRPWFSDEEIDDSINHGQLKALYAQFVVDFIDNPFSVNGKKIKIQKASPRQKEFSDYCETFFHIISRKNHFYNDRLYECNRANRSHWIKPILLAHPCTDILYYKWRDHQGVCKEHYWLMSKGFMVVLKNISTDVQIVTAFCVDDDEKLKFYERYKAHKEGNSTC
jgi:hypothetical protein